MDPLTLKVAARFQRKKKLDTGTVVYEYSERQVADRDRRKARRLEKLRGGVDQLRRQVSKDLKSKDPSKKLTALAVALMDETYERVGNDESAGEGHFGVTGWKKEHISFGSGGATVSYVGKSSVRQKKTVSNPAVVSALRDAYSKCKGSDCIFKQEEASVGAEDVNAYLKSFDITAKDIRGLHANEVMKRKLKAVKGGSLPSEEKKRSAILKKQFQKALDETAGEVGHEASTLRSQYLVPSLESDFLKDGTVIDKLDKKKSSGVPPDPKA